MTLAPSHQQKKERPPQCIFTELYSKDVRSVIRFDEHDLILVREVEWLAIICSDREVKCGGVDLRNCCEQGGGEVELSNQFRPAETKLRIAGISSGNKY